MSACAGSGKVVPTSRQRQDPGGEGVGAPATTTGQSPGRARAATSPPSPPSGPSLSAAPSWVGPVVQSDAAAGPAPPTPAGPRGPAGSPAVGDGAVMPIGGRLVIDLPAPEGDSQ